MPTSAPTNPRVSVLSPKRIAKSAPANAYVPRRAACAKRFPNMIKRKVRFPHNRNDVARAVRAPSGRTTVRSGSRSRTAMETPTPTSTRATPAKAHRQSRLAATSVPKGTPTI